ncbi:MAG: cation diffusion facilitator family transporter [Dehalococcoidia bacterium]|nr:cation diffusion facilitator family transporter [Dehalococcoidia bacterium]
MDISQAHSHSHDAHGHASMLGSKLKFALIVTSVIFVGELAGGYFSNSLALMSDAGHMFTDVLALLLSWVGVRQAARLPTNRMTYGFHRIGVLIALANSLTLVGIAVVILYEAFRRLSSPVEVESVLMLVVALVGFGANALILVLLRGERKGNINVRSAFLHVAGDALASLTVIAGGIAMYFTNAFWLDPVLSVGIAIIIAIGSWQIIQEGISVFLEATPPHVNLEDMIHNLKKVDGVLDVHDLHVWSIAPHLHALSCHVLIDDQHISEGSGILQRLNSTLGDTYGITHTTVQFECVSCDPDSFFCTFAASPSVAHAHKH